MTLRKCDFEMLFDNETCAVGDIASLLGYGFTDEELKFLADLHREGKYSEKIEDLLTCCNFHTECAEFAKGYYGILEGGSK